MPVRFVARALAVEDLPDLNTFLIALADDAEEPTHTLELQKALEDDGDEEHDFDSYCLAVDAGATHYGGITACRLSGRSLVLSLDDGAAGVLGTDGFEIELDLDQGERAALRDGLFQLFQGDRLEPAELVLE